MMEQRNQESQESVNFIHHFLNAMDKISETPEMNPTHVSLYVGFFILWNKRNFENPISINRREMMMLSKIGSKHTYYKCLKDLHKMGFFKYIPSRTPSKGSLIYMFNFGTSTEQEQVFTWGKSGTSTAQDRGKSGTSGEQVLHLSRGNSGTSSEQVLHPSINNTNYINNKQYICEKKFQENRNEKIFASNSKRINAQIQDSDENESAIDFHFNSPSINELKTFFEQQSEEYAIPVRFAPVEAEKFFNYYSAKGWKVGSKSPMKDWKAAVRNWLLNFKKFNNIQEEKSEAGKLHINEGKMYDIPL